ncbi:tetratricopeptide repeat protein [Teredinibacter haidensis]|uniref:tetratricopeptide repeat protein n=1 Tax=Teredinibacter haidensis TaxID=2731755 RepID=UPI0009490CEE|nr:hypothetical protein [Teredinibacter haidensis]
MKGIIKISLLGALLALLSGCNTTQVKPQAPQNQTAFAMGTEAYTAFLNSGSSEQISAAVYYLNRALLEHPQKVMVQKNHYLSHYMQTAYFGGDSIAPLRNIFYALHPAIQKEVPPPTRLLYFDAKEDKNISDEEFESLIHEMIREQPINASSWNSLSTYYENRQNYWLALAAAKQANQLEPDNINILYQLGDSINDVIQQSDCVYEQKEYAKRAVSYIAKAAAKEPNQLYLDNASLQYLRLGLFPMAYHQGKKAWEAEKNKWTAYHYGEASLHLNHYNEALEAARFSIENNDAVTGFILQAQAYVGQGSFAKAIQSLDALENYWAENPRGNQYPLQALHKEWLYSLLSSKKNAPAVSLKNDEQNWVNTVLTQFSTEKGQLPPSLVTQAENQCEMTEAYFYDAYKYWLQGDMVRTKEYLAKAANSDTTLYDEYTWANLLLNSPLLD